MSILSRLHGVATGITRLEKNQDLVCNLAIGIFFLLVLASVQFHEMWRDEIHTWAVALSGGSIAEMFRIKGYDGHPGLWYILTYFLTRITKDPLIFQIFHVAIATGSAAVFLKRAPFPLPQRLLFAFGYYSVFEYALIARAYGLGIGLAFVYVAVFASPRKRPLVAAGALFLASQTSAYGAILAGAFCPLVFIEFLRTIREPGRDRYEWALATLLVAGGISLAVWQCLPSGSTLAGTLGTILVPSTGIQVLSDFFSGFFPLPPFTEAFWNRNFLASPGLKAIFGGLALLYTMALLARTPIVLLLSYVPGLAAMTAVNAYYEGYLRHHGHFFILFLCCLWLAEKYPKWQPGPWLLNEAWRLRELFLYSALGIQLIAGVYAVWQDWRLPFSASQETAASVHARGWDQGRLYGDFDFAAAAVAAYLNHPFYFPRTNATGTFVHWETRRMRPLSQPEMIVDMIADVESSGTPVAAVLNYPLATTSPNVELVYTSSPAIVADEQFFLYRVVPTPAQPPGPIYDLTTAGLAAPGHPVVALEDRLSGWVDVDAEIRGYVHFSGWATDPRSVTPARAVVVLLDGRWMYEFRPGLDRPDVAAFFRVPRLQAGFNILLRAPARTGQIRPRIQFFAVSTRGVAAELRYHQGYSWTGK